MLNVKEMHRVLDVKYAIAVGLLHHEKNGNKLLNRLRFLSLVHF
jgi:hypothetical protein